MFAEGIINVLLIEDEEFDVRRVQNTIKPFAEQIKIGKIVSDGRSALDLLKEKSERFDLVIMDFQIAGGLMGEDLIHKIKELDSALQIIVVTKMTVNISDYAFANKLMKAGAFWYCTKYPGDIEEFIYQPTDFIISIFNAFEKRKLELERLKANQKLVRNAEEILEQRRLVGESTEMYRLRDQITKCSNSTINVLIRGASGTGKELVAYNIHYNSARKLENFVIINCGSLPHDLVESELFGYEKGAFTGADKKKLGLFEIAHNGTIFLDEVTELPLAAQVKLLRVIQDGEIEKIGRTEKVKVDVRILAASNRNIEEEVKAKRFREDLYYRLNVLPVFVPDLKYRKGDISILLDYFMTTMSIDMIRMKPTFEKEAMDLLTNYEWPGNVRELKNVVQRLLFNDEKVITLKDASLALGKYGFSEEAQEQNGIHFDRENILPLRELEVFVRQKYFTFVRENSSSDTDAAKKLGLAPPNYFRMAKELGMK